MATYSTMLTAIQTAIATLIANPAAEVDVDGKRVKYVDISKLYDQEARLRVMAAREANTRQGARFRSASPR